MPSLDTASVPTSDLTSLLVCTLKGAALGLGVGTICLPWYVMRCFLALREQEIEKKEYVLSWARMGAGVGCAVGLFSLLNSADMSASGNFSKTRGSI